MKEGRDQTARVEASLRGHANDLLKAQSASAIVAALQRFAGRLGLGLECVIAIGVGQGAEVPARLIGRLPRARREDLKALKPFHAHPLVAETLTAGVPLTGSEIRKRRLLTPAAWRDVLPAALRKRELLNLAVRTDHLGAWFVAFRLRGDGANGLLRSAALVATQLAYERYRAKTPSKRKRRLK